MSAEVQEIRGTADAVGQGASPGGDPELAATKAFSRRIVAWLLKGREELEQMEARGESVHRVEAQPDFDPAEKKAEEHSRRVTAWLLQSRERSSNT